MTIREARDAYLALRDRARSLRPVADRRYIDALWMAWDDRLAQWPPETALPPRYPEHLTETIADPQLDSEAVMAWLDAYPDAIVDRLPGGLFA